MKTSFLNRLYRYFTLKPAGPSEVWQTTDRKLIRQEKTIECDWFGYTYWDVYAVYQKSLTTGRERIVEEWKLS